LLFNRDRFFQFLQTQSFGRSLYLYEQLPSTNTHLWELMANGAEVGTTVIAIEQTAGRGQWGRTWVSAVGGLYLSVAIAPKLLAQDSTQLTIASAWGVATQLRQRHIPVQLKWPNDLYLQDKKLGGILTETAIRGTQLQTAVIGIGMNWCNPVPEQAIALSNWLQVEQALNPFQALEELAALVLQGLEMGHLTLVSQGIAAMLPDYQAWLWGDRQPFEAFCRNYQ
jgi:BirA family transcriptional regulator, biotin operon repressor / biotin---[acetyl-CoA-carboxylase] ligase